MDRGEAARNHEHECCPNRRALLLWCSRKLGPRPPCRPAMAGSCQQTGQGSGLPDTTPLLAGHLSFMASLEVYCN